MIAVLSALSVFIVPLLLLTIPVYAFYRGVSVYDEFIDGAREGLMLCLRLLPVLIAMMAATSVFIDGGGMNFLVRFFSPLCDLFGLPREVFPLAFIRPLSGTGSLGFTSQLIHAYGPDSLIGRFASVAQGSTETTFYVLSIYFGAVAVRRFRYALLVGLVGDAVAFAAAFILTKVFFY